MTFYGAVPQVYVNDGGEVPLERVVAVVAHLTGNRRRWGSGFLITPTVVMTAWHCTVDDHDTEEVPREVAVEVIRTVQGKQLAPVPVAKRLVTRPSKRDKEGRWGLDLALLMLENAPWAGEDWKLPEFARVYRDETGELTDCIAVGYPSYALMAGDNQPGMSEVRGFIRRTDGRGSRPHLVFHDEKRGDVNLRPNGDQEPGQSPWGGISGALVFRRGRVLGHVIEHRPYLGANPLIVVPIDRLSRAKGEKARRIAATLGVSSEEALPWENKDPTDVARHGFSHRGHDPWAVWVPTDVDPFGAQPMNIVEDLGMRVDVLWVRDRSALRAILADVQGADLAGTLNAGEAAHGFVHDLQRHWTQIDIPFDELPPSVSRADLLTWMNTDREDRRRRGFVLSWRVPESEPLGSATDFVADRFEYLAAHLTDDALVLRVESAEASVAIRAVAAIGSVLRHRVRGMDVASRIRSTVNARPLAGGTTSEPLQVVLSQIDEKIRSVRAGISWQVSSDSPSHTLCIDSAQAIVDALNRNRAVLVDGLREGEFLRRVREYVPNLWPLLLAEHAANRDGDGWYAGLEVASEWRRDLADWVRSAKARPDALLDHPEKALGRLSPEATARLAILRMEHGGESTWLQYWDRDLARVLQDESGAVHSQEIPRSYARALVRRWPKVAARFGGPTSSMYWMRLASDPSVDPTIAGEVGVRIEEVISAAPMPNSDPLRAQMVGYYRRLVRPLGVEK